MKVEWHKAPIDPQDVAEVLSHLVKTCLAEAISYQNSIGVFAVQREMETHGCKMQVSCTSSSLTARLTATSRDFSKKKGGK